MSAGSRVNGKNSRHFGCDGVKKERMNATINDNASGATKRLIGRDVEVLELAPNGRSARVRFAEVRPGYKNGGTWLPTKWLDGLDNRHQDDPVVTVTRCPTCGQEVE